MEENNPRSRMASHISVTNEEFDEKEKSYPETELKTKQ